MRISDWSSDVCSSDLPLIASATATFLFCQFFLTVPDELVEAARMDGAGPLRFFKDILLPLTRTTIAALFVILFLSGWHQLGRASCRGSVCQAGVMLGVAVSLTKQITNKEEVSS